MASFLITARDPAATDRLVTCGFADLGGPCVTASAPELKGGRMGPRLRDLFAAMAPGTSQTLEAGTVLARCA